MLEGGWCEGGEGRVQQQAGIRFAVAPVRKGEGGRRRVGMGDGGGAAHLACFRRDATALGWPKMPIIDGRTVDNGRSCCRAEYRG